MSRPPSATSSASALSTVKPSKPSNSPIRPSDTALFVTNLRLLDLDRRPDWPGITEQTFSTKDAQQNQKNRIRCVEWALYRLFELWDPAETRDKLQPFFPPLEPLQSLNLRAALYRCLNELKKNGVLGRESVLRKTMLDECKGDKLAEILMLFSYAVLKKVAAGKKDKLRSEPIARRLATAAKLSGQEQKSLLPLAVAHKAALMAVLRKKQERRGHYREFEQLLEVKTEDVLQRNERCKVSAPSSSYQVDSVHVKRQLRENWLGNPKWVDVMLHGDGAQSDDALFDSRFNSICDSIRQGHVLEDTKDQRGLLQELESRVKVQQERLRDWKGFHTQVSRFNAHDALAKPESKPRENILYTNFGFDAHQHLQIGSTVSSSETSQPRSQFPSSARGIKYQAIIAKMKEDLSKAGHARRQSQPASQTEKPKPASTPSRARPRPRSIICGSGLKELKLKPSATFPYMTSPPRISPSMTSPSVNEEPPNGSPEPSKKLPTLGDIPHFPPSTSTPISEKTLVQSETTSDDEALNHLAAEGPNTDLDQNEWQPQAVQQQPTSPYFNIPTSPHLTEQDLLAEQILSSITQATPSPTKRPRPALIDRTRMSMAHSTALSILPTTSELSSPAPVIEASPPSPSNTVDPHASLLERTRQSMSHLPAHPRSYIRRKSKRESRQSLFPVNQFETPKKPNSSNEDFGGGEERDTTPKERLFEEDAEYASVFKSRPKVAVSPVLSPCGDGRGDESA